MAGGIKHETTTTRTQTKVDFSIQIDICRTSETPFQKMREILQKHLRKKLNIYPLWRSIFEQKKRIQVWTERRIDNII